MKKLVVTESITLDGVIDASEGWFAPAGDEKVDQSDINEALSEQAEAADMLVLGRVTFEEFRGYWPLQTDDETGAEGVPQQRLKVRRIQHDEGSGVGAEYRAVRRPRAQRPRAQGQVWQGHCRDRASPSCTS